MAAPEQYECDDCGACWAEKKAKWCMHCESKNIRVIWRPKGRKKWKIRKITNLENEAVV